MVTYPSTHGVFEEEIAGHLRHRARARRAGVHGRREHERAGRALPPGRRRRRRLPPEPAQDVLHPARRRRSGHGPDRRGGAPRAHSCRATRSSQTAASRASARCPRRRGAARASSSSRGRTSQMMGARRADARDEVAILNANYIATRLEPHFPVLYTRQERARRARVHLRPAPAEAARRHRGRRHREAADGLRLPRADDVVPGRRARSWWSRPRARRRTSSIASARRMIAIREEIRAVERRQGRREGQLAEERAAHGRRGDGERVEARLLARAGGVPGAVDARAQVLAARGAHQQRVRRPEPRVLVPADRGVRGGRVENRQGRQERKEKDWVEERCGR